MSYEYFGADGKQLLNYNGIHYQYGEFPEEQILKDVQIPRAWSIDINAKDDYGTNVIHELCYVCNCDRLELVLMHPLIDVNELDNDGNAPLDLLLNNDNLFGGEDQCATFMIYDPRVKKPTPKMQIRTLGQTIGYAFYYKFFIWGGIEHWPTNAQGQLSDSYNMAHVKHHYKDYIHHLRQTNELGARYVSLGFATWLELMSMGFYSPHKKISGGDDNNAHRFAIICHKLPFELQFNMASTVVGWKRTNPTSGDRRRIVVYSNWFLLNDK